MENSTHDSKYFATDFVYVENSTWRMAYVHHISYEIFILDILLKISDGKKQFKGKALHP